MRDNDRLEGEEGALGARGATGLTPLSQLDDYEVADGDPDVRGWRVAGPDGQAVGTVEDLLVDVGAQRVRYLLVSFEGAGGTRRVPVEPATLDRDRREIQIATNLLETEAGAQYAEGAAFAGGEEARVTRTEEELAIGKQRVQAGEINIRKRIETERVAQPVSRMHEEVEIERRPVMEGRSTEVEIGADEIRIPVVEEEIVVEKRPVVKEELVVRADTVTEQRVVEADVRRERVDVERTDADGRRTIDESGRDAR